MEFTERRNSEDVDRPSDLRNHMLNKKNVSSMSSPNTESLIEL